MATTLPDQPSSPVNPGINKKASPNTDTMLANAGAQTARVVEESGKAGSPTDAETLLGALRNVIIPLIRPAAANGEYKHDANQNALGPDGEQFVIALEKFMLSFLRSQRGPVGDIEVDLEEKGTDISTAGSEATSDDYLNPEDVVDMAPETESPSDRSAPEGNTSQEGPGSIKVSNEESPDRSVVFISDTASISDTDILEQRKSQFITKALYALREHVFNAMPIRLLCFKADGSKLQITLIERGEIYAHIASSIETTNFADVSRKITEEEDRLARSPRQFDQRTAERNVIEKLIGQYSRYAILSHTWLRGDSREVTYGDWNRGEFDAQQPGYRKLVNFCRTAWHDYGVVFGWMDTICINKESSAELDESIRSMYKWYNNAHICITYLAETKILPDMHNDSWFTRGWTLQELFAPSNMKFYNTNWKKLVESNKNDKKKSAILKRIKEATTITAFELQREIRLIPISRRMQMAAKRQVTREEDSAYSLMGIFDVSMATAYGEGANRAFSRLLQEVLNSSFSFGIADIFNWAGPGAHDSYISSLLPSSPRGYLHRSSSPSLDIWGKPVEPIMLTHLGLRITIVLLPAVSIENPTESLYDSIGDYHAIANISILPEYLSVSMSRIIGGSYSVLDARISDNDQRNKKNRYQLIFGVLTIGDGGNREIVVSNSCLAVALQYFGGSPFKVPTEAPTTFTLNKRRDHAEGADNYYIKRSELKSHGMKLVTIVL